MAIRILLGTGAAVGLVAAVVSMARTVVATDVDFAAARRRVLDDSRMLAADLRRLQLGSRDEPDGAPVHEPAPR